MAVRKNSVKQEVEVSNEIETIKEKQEVKPQPPKKFERTDLVEIKNNSGGALAIPSLSPEYNYILNYHGDTETLEFRELENIRNRHPLFFQNGWITISDADAVKALRIDRFYKNLMTDEEVEEFFASDIDNMEDILQQSSPQNRTLLLNVTRDKIRTGELDSNSKIRFLEQYFKMTLVVEER